jgi:AcrR family transcriptional regulator
VSETTADQRAEATRTALIDAALDLLGDHGPWAVSSRAIARRAGVSYGLVHYHFGSRQELILAAVRAAVVRYRMEATGSLWDFDLVTTPPPPAVLRTLFYIALDWEQFAPSYVSLRYESASLASLRGRFEGEADPIRIAAAYMAATAVQLGWLVIGPQQTIATATPATDVPDVLRFVRAVVDAILALALREPRPLPHLAQRMPAARDGVEPTEKDLPAREKLLAATIDLLAERGLAGFSARAVAEQAGVNYGLVHYYFGSKNNLLSETVERALGRYRTVSATSDWTPAVLLDPLGREHLRPLIYLILEWESTAEVFAQPDLMATIRVPTLLERYPGIDETWIRAALVTSNCFQAGWASLGPLLCDVAATTSDSERRRVHDFMIEVDDEILRVARRCSTSPELEDRTPSERK